MFDENQGKSHVVGVEKTHTARATPHTERRHQVGVSTAKLSTGRGASHVRTLKSCEAETGAPSACHLSKAQTPYTQQAHTKRQWHSKSTNPSRVVLLYWHPPPPKNVHSARSHPAAAHHGHQLPRQLRGWQLPDPQRPQTRPRRQTQTYEPCGRAPQSPRAGGWPASRWALRASGRGAPALAPAPRHPLSTTS